MVLPKLSRQIVAPVGKRKLLSSLYRTVKRIKNKALQDLSIAFYNQSSSLFFFKAPEASDGLIPIPTYCGWL